MRLIDIKQLSEFLNVKESTLYSWANGGSMPAYRIMEYGVLIWMRLRYGLKRERVYLNS